MPKLLFQCASFKLNAILNIRKVELEIISDSDMYLVFEKGMRGGVSYLSRRYSKANNKYLKYCPLKMFA